MVIEEYLRTNHGMIPPPHLNGKKKNFSDNILAGECAGSSSSQYTVKGSINWQNPSVDLGTLPGF